MFQRKNLPANKVYDGKRFIITGIIFGIVFLLVAINSAIAIMYDSKEPLLVRLLLILFFSGGFGGFGYYVLKSSLPRKSFDNEMRYIKKSGISSEEKSAYIPIYIAAVVLLSLATLAAYQGVISKSWVGLVGLPFALVGAGLLWFARRRQHIYKVIGATVLQLDPVPAILGRQLGGWFYLNAAPKETVVMRLVCKHVYYVGVGDSRKMHTESLHDVQTYGYVSGLGLNGRKVEFLFELPENLPETGCNRYRGDIHWELIAESSVVASSQDKNALSLSRTWKVPVLNESFVLAAGWQVADSNISIPHHFIETQAEAETVLAIKNEVDTNDKRITMDVIDHDHTRIVSRSGRISGMYIFLMILGLAFCTAGGYIFADLIQEEGIIWLAASVPFLIGLSVVFLSVFLAGRRLEFDLNAGKASVTRKVFGCPLYRRSGVLKSSKHLKLEVTMTSESDSAVTEYLTVYAKLNDKRVKLVEGIVGRHSGEEMLAKITELIDA